MRKPIHPAVAAVVVAAALGLIVFLYTVVGRDYGNTGYHMTKEDYKRAAAFIKHIEKHGLGAPAMRAPGEPQPYLDAGRTQRNPAWEAWKAKQK